VTQVSQTGQYVPLYAALRERWAAGIRCPSEAMFAFSVSLIWAALYNFSFWQQTAAAMWHPAANAALFMVSLLIVVLTAQAALLLLLPTRVLMKAAASVLFIIAAASSYFCDSYGAIMDKDMMRNVLETDPAEVGGLVNGNLLMHLLLLGVIPAILLWRVQIPAASWRSQLRRRATFLGAALTLSIAGMFACSATYAVFFREHKPIRFALSPAAPVTSLAGLVSEKRNDPNERKPLIDPAGNVQRVAGPHAKPLVIFLVIGETARAANFQLGGYTRATNPQLRAADGVVYFDHASSCGTSTAISVPCIFSHFDRARFEVDAAGRYTNLLDSLVKAGVDVEWRDNNAGCKGVCARVREIDYTSRPDPALCPQAYCYDEVMLGDLPARLEAVNRDTVIVFHQIGSHGPAYSERYPPQFELFKPACRSNQLQRCTPQEIVNAYDNTIAYTDHVLARQIALLRAASSRVDGVLIYASDHGESLGEQGLYLHGMPYRFAPRTQKEVPMLLWTSQSYAEREGLRAGCLAARAGEPLSHDNLYHTVLGATEVRNDVYDPKLDLLSGCRAAG
jgi:lipid A ethanolaminephosphotransferase